MAKIIKKNRGSDLTMTKEQEAIEILNKFKNSEMQRDKLERGRDGGWKIGDIYKLLELNPAIETVFNMLKGKSMQIDLMADFIDKTGAGRRAFSCVFRKNDECDENGCRNCIKQYFKRKATNNG